MSEFNNYKLKHILKIKMNINALKIRMNQLNRKAKKGKKIILGNYTKMKVSLYMNKSENSSEKVKKLQIMECEQKKLIEIK